ncbi:hypothetical protein TKK_0011912 [Trichogramma kaykai]|uniref:Protein takeout n=1 Tax=Trichogramma kaykai TaxID=54128 RepID=A0ABD2WNF6_9HYME
MKSMSLSIILAVCAVTSFTEAGKYKGLEFLEPCRKNSPGLEDCLKRSANALATNFQRGMPELGYTEVEPIILDELYIQLGDGPNGYKANFNDIEARGVSAVQVTALRSRIDDEEVQIQMTLDIPTIRAIAKYRSSGQLLLVKASGGGDYWGQYDGVKAKVFIRAKPYVTQGQKFLRLQQLKLDFTVRNIKMGVENIKDSNTILQAALNLFINTNSQELLKEMKPDLRRKLVQQMSSFVEKIFAQVPYDAFIVD